MDRSTQEWINGLAKSIGREDLVKQDRDADWTDKTKVYPSKILQDFEKFAVYVDFTTHAEVDLEYYRNMLDCEIDDDWDVGAIGNYSMDVRMSEYFALIASAKYIQTFLAPLDPDYRAMWENVLIPLIANDKDPNMMDDGDWESYPDRANNKWIFNTNISRPR